jgi:hypothetical protein
MKLTYEIPEKLIKILQEYKDVDLSYNKYKNGSHPYGYRSSL